MRTSLAAGLAAVPVLLVALIGTGFLLIDVHTMATDSLEPEIHRGDVVIVLQRRLIEVEIQPDDIVSFRRDGKTMLRKVVRLEDGTIWINDDGRDQALKSSDVKGKVVYSTPVDR
jgi:hypothetical protein